jgi:hypothetical protein
LSLEHRGSLFHHHALRFQCRSPPACAQSERTQDNDRPGIETELCQFENGPERLPMTNQIKSPAFSFEFGNEQLGNPTLCRTTLLLHDFG